MHGGRREGHRLAQEHGKAGPQDPRRQADPLTLRRAIKRGIEAAEVGCFRRAARPFLRWRSPLRSGLPERCTVVLLNYRRSFNLDLQIRLALACAFVGEVLVSNNDPACDLSRHIAIDDPRIRRIEHGARRYASVRFEVARAARYPWIVAIDDDVFPRPGQIRQLFEALVADPGRPHGWGGQRYPPDLGADGAMPPGAGLRFAYRQEREVDALVWAFAFTTAVNERYFRLLEAIGETNDTVTSSEDVPLSFAGDRAAVVHDHGRILQCPTSHDDGVATYRQDGFMARRAQLVARCREAAGIRPGAAACG